MDAQATAGHECGVLIGMAVWSSLATVLLRWFNLPGRIPSNLVFSFAAVTSVNQNLVMHMPNFSWTNHLIRILTDVLVMGVGLITNEAIILMFGLNFDYDEDEDVYDMVQNVAKDRSSMLKLVAFPLVYITHFTLLGSYRLAWNLICLPCIHVFGTIMQYLFPAEG